MSEGVALYINEDGGEPLYHARDLRRALGGLVSATRDGDGSGRFGKRAGVFRNTSNDEVELSGTTVIVRDLQAVARGLSNIGPYLVAIPEHTHSLDPADGSNPRVDIVILEVLDDDEDSSGERKARTRYIAGTPGSSPGQPSTPDHAITLAVIDVPASGQGSPSLEYVAPFTVAAGGIVPVRHDDEYPTGVRRDGDALWDIAARALVAWSDGEWETVAAVESPTRVVMDSNGSFAKADYPWAKRFDVQVIGGGGGGGGGESTPNDGESYSFGDGGGAGEWARGTYAPGDLPSSVSVTVGSGGSGGTGDSDGSDGDATSFGSLLTAEGGGGGGHRPTASTPGNILAVGTTGPDDRRGGSGGSGGDERASGQHGERGMGVGGGSRQVRGGDGGDGPWGGGGLAGWNGANGGPGQGPGAGGGGAGNPNNRSTSTGGTGSDGRVIIDIT